MTRTRFLLPMALAVVLAAGACGIDLEGLEAPDGGASGDASTDTATVDVTTLDTSAYDTGAPEGSLLDTEEGDTQSVDTGVGDTEVPDAGSSDTGAPSDGGVCPNNWQCIGGPIPSGWTLLELSLGANPAPCDTNFGTPALVYDGPFPPATCTCSSKLGTSGSCTSGNINEGFGDPGCTIPASVSASGCDTLQVALTPPTGLQVSVAPAPYAAGTCSTAPTGPPPPAVVAAGQTCALDQPAGGEGCTNGQVCAPITTGNYHHCIVAAGSQACPGLGYVNAQTLGQGYVDTRECSACSAVTPTATCNNAQVSFYTDTGCTQGVQTVQANSTCGNFPGPTGGGAPTYKTQKYTATVQNETCGASSSTPTGGVTLTGEFTVCCR